MSSVTQGAAIVGHGYRIQGLEGEPLSGMQLIAMATADALADAGIGKDQVGGLFTPRSPAADRVFQYNMKVANELKIMPMITSEVDTHGAGSLSMLFHAAHAVNSGYIDYAICVAGDTGRRGSTNPAQNAAIEADPYFELPLRPSTPSLYAQVATRYMHESGATREQFAHAAVQQREWALHHPDAVMHRKGPLTVEKVLASRPITSPLHLLDCAPFYGGGSASAFVVARREHARNADRPVYLHGVGEAAAYEFLTDRFGLDEPRLEPERPLTGLAATPAARTAFHQAGIDHSAIDIVETSVPFSFALSLILESLGFCERDNGGKFIAGGGIDFDGGLPFNTNGGMLSFGQAGAACVADMVSEGVLQLRGRAPGKQVENARTALIHGHGGILACHAVMIASTEEP